MMSWVKRKVLIPLRKALKNGVSQKKLAVSLALGITIGLIPFYGLTTILVGIIAYALRLDFIIMQTVHYIVHPLQLILLIPFFKAGSLFVGHHAVDFTVSEYITLFKNDFWLALSELWKANLLAIIVWGFLAIPLFYGLYNIFRYTIKRYAHVLVRRPAYKA
jgi:uncharacterized protein (DUF2062 family)